jgi:glycerol kinase
MPDDVILAIDQGSSSTKALFVALDGSIVASGTAAIGHSFPAAGWVEQSPEEILQSVLDAVGQCRGSHPDACVVSAGISNQRESLVLWERATGQAVLPLISWQDQRTAGMCADYLQRGHAEQVRKRSGLPLDPMFSATKARWLLDTADPDRSRSRRGELCLGTVDSWLLARLGDEHVIEVGNASRTQLLNVDTLDWDPTLLALFDVPPQVLPRVLPSSGPFPELRGVAGLVDGTPVAAVMGDSHAALFAQAGWTPGHVKVTYGTGSSVMSLCRPDQAPLAGLCLTVAWADRQPSYAVEGNIRATGATLTWLARALDRDPGALAELARTASSDGVYLVPGFNGLGAPYWDAEAVGLISGLTLGVGLPQLSRAALESVAFQVEDVIAAMEGSTTPIRAVLADGGASRNSMLMQIQADLSGREIYRSTAGDLSALGVAHLAGRTVGVWTEPDIERLPRPRDRFQPGGSAQLRSERKAGWHAAVSRSRGLPVRPDRRPRVGRGSAARA